MAGARAGLCQQLGRVTLVTDILEAGNHAALDERLSLLTLSRPCQRIDRVGER
jgi:hypothetical protein